MICYFFAIFILDDYLYIHFDNESIDAKGPLHSPELFSENNNKAKCLQFYYHVSGSDIGAPMVYIKGEDDKRNIWSSPVNHVNDWT